MTNATPNPVARYERLLARARDIHDKVARLAADLDGQGEGEGFASVAQTNMEVVIKKLEDKVNGRCVHGGQ